jgi:translation initiation factor 1
MTEEPEFGIPSGADVFKEIAKSEQNITVRLDTRRYGKKITLVSGFDKSVDIKATAKKLKESLACGGTVKDGTIELQGNHKKQVRPILASLGFPDESISD